jgi:hypothetical protein
VPGKREASAGTGIALGLIVLAGLVAYSPVLFNFFNGDDFVHLTWLTDAVKNSELIWRNFHSSWLDGTTTRFYRPLISVFMVGDYLVWGANGLGFHLTNLACHLASSILLFFIVRQVAAEAQPNDSGIAWPFAAAALFAAYPLHPEAVSWITGRVDAIVTVFALASFWSYICWRRDGKLRHLACAAGTMVLALLSKEMAVTLPPLFVLWEVLRPREPGAGLVKGVRNIIQPTILFWLVLVGYFVVRRIALGTFVGGYDDSLFFVANPKLFIGGWIHGLRMLLVPINQELLGAHHPLTKIWQAALVISIAGSILAAARYPGLRKPFVFLTGWLALSLLPVYKIFAIADDLEGSRLAYLATVPLCAILTFGLCTISSVRLSSPGHRLASLFKLASAVLVCAAVALLWVNNQAWHDAGVQSNAIRKQLDLLYSQIQGDPQTLFIGLPDNIKGAYVCRNALPGMTRYPQMHRTVSNCLMVGQFEPILPFGFLKESLAQNKDAIKIFGWNVADRHFFPVEIPVQQEGDGCRSWSATQLKDILEPAKEGTSKYSWLPDGSLEAIGAAGLRGRPNIGLKLAGRACWSIGVLAVRIKRLDAFEQSVGADLLYCNDLHPTSDLRRRIHTALPAGETTAYFSLHGAPEWALGGNCRALNLLLPDNCQAIVESVELLSAEEVMPAISFPNSGYLGSKGFVHLAAGEERSLTVSAGKIQGARRLELEITRANLTFEEQNSNAPSRVVLKRLECGTASGAIILRRSDFPASGIYEARLRALDSQGKQIGVAGDHIVISVDS